jgi:hypothetical protein
VTIAALRFSLYPGYPGWKMVINGLQEEEVERWGHIQYCKVPIPEKEARMGWG